jgi:pilus assembly protein CpaB
VTRTVLQNVQVLSTGTKTEPDPQGKPENVGVVTLLTTPEDSEKLFLAGSQGSIQFVLRNGGDNATANTASIDLAELSGLAKKPAAITPQPGRRVANVYIVETVAGDKTSVAKF